MPDADCSRLTFENAVPTLMALVKNSRGRVQVLAFCARCVVIIYTIRRDAKATEMDNLRMRGIVERIFTQTEDWSAMADVCREIMNAMRQLQCLCNPSA